MPERKFLVPKPDFTVNDPATMQPLPPEGALKAMNSYWRRRLRDGDVTVQDGPAAAPAAPAATENGE